MADDFYDIEIQRVRIFHFSLRTLYELSLLNPDRLITYINNQMHEDVAQSVKLLLLNKLE